MEESSDERCGVEDTDDYTSSDYSCPELQALHLHNGHLDDRFMPPDDSRSVDGISLPKRHRFKSENGISLFAEAERVQYLEDQHELLNTSLMALTTHFAQVQFRLSQIVNTPDDEKANLLKDLEEFAFRGIPEVQCSQPILSLDSDGHKNLTTRRENLKTLIADLRTQLHDLEQYAYQLGEADLPQSDLIERQRVIIDQLKLKLSLQLDNMNQMSLDDLRSTVDSAVGQLVNPLKLKEDLVLQMKTQISDLERYVQFLQNEAPSETICDCNCQCRYHSHSSNYSERKKFHEETRQELRAKTMNLVNRMTALVHIFAGSYDYAGSTSFKKNTLKKTTKVNHWGDLRAQLEVSIAEVLRLLADPELATDSDYLSDSETLVQCNGKMAAAVRKHLATAIRNLIQHGLMPMGQSRSIVPFIGCFAHRSSAVTPMHAWDLILKYYGLKNGDQFNSTPARKLLLSYNLDIVAGRASSNKESLLATVGNIKLTHARYKRTYDSHFKAFICAGLNEKKLVGWLKLVLRCQTLIDHYYQPWSYVVKTGFEDSFKSLEQLHLHTFDLPVDLAIRQLQNMKDAF